jgi:multiple sugar transport system ATP-binding protein
MFVAGFIGSPPMNFIPVTVEGGAARLPFASAPLAGDVLERLPPHQLLVAGIRPEHFEVASLVRPELREHGVTFRVTVDVAEWIGAEQLAYVLYDAPPAIASTLRTLARDLDSEALRTQLVVSLDAASPVRSGDVAELWLDPRRMHFFDPRTGDNLGRA